MTTDNAPSRLPPGHILNPGLRAEAKRLWPGHPVSETMLADAAKVSGMPMFIPATREAVAAGMAQLAAEQRQDAVKAQTAADYRRMGFDPTKNYREEKSQ